MRISKEKKTASRKAHFQGKRKKDKATLMIKIIIIEAGTVKSSLKRPETQGKTIKRKRRFSNEVQQLHKNLQFN